MNKLTNVIEVDFMLRPTKVEKAARKIIDASCYASMVHPAEFGREMFARQTARATEDLSDREKFEVRRVMSLQETIGQDERGAS